MCFGAGFCLLGIKFSTLLWVPSRSYFPKTPEAEEQSKHVGGCFALPLRLNFHIFQFSFQVVLCQKNSFPAQGCSCCWHRWEIPGILELSGIPVSCWDTEPAAHPPLPRASPGVHLGRKAWNCLAVETSQEFHLRIPNSSSPCSLGLP